METTAMQEPQPQAGTAPASIIQDRSNIRNGGVIRMLRDNPYGISRLTGDLCRIVDTEVGDTEFHVARDATSSQAMWAMHYDELGVGYEIHSLPPKKEKKPPAAMDPIAANDWLRILCSQTGADFSLIPKAQLTEMLTQTNKAEVNKLFFAWLEGSKPAPVVLDDEAAKMFSNYITPLTTQEYRQAKDYASRCHRQANEYLSHVQAQLTEMGKYEEKMRVIEGKASIDLYPKIQAALADGWYTLDVEGTKVGADPTLSEDMYVVFITPRVNLSHFNANAGIEQNVDMGSFRVLWYPRRSYLKVKTHEDNIAIGGYPHPHVSSDNSVCWGNGSAAYTTAMRELDPAKALQTLRVILTNYNAASPYKRIEAYAERRGQVPSGGIPTEMAEYGRRAWVYQHHMPDSWASTYVHDEEHDSLYDDDDNELDEADENTRRHLCTLFYKRTLTGGRAPGEENLYYVKHRNGRYHEVDSNDFYGWE